MRALGECGHSLLDPLTGNEVLCSMVQADAIQVSTERRENRASRK